MMLRSPVVDRFVAAELYNRRVAELVAAGVAVRFEESCEMRYGAARSRISTKPQP